MLRPGDSRPHYQAIADSLEDGIRREELRPGDRLPTHRDLAKRLGVTVGTVSRAYAEAERRGLLEGEVGRGTFVRANPIAGQPFSSTTPTELVDLRTNLAPVPEGSRLQETFAAALRAMSEREELRAMFDPEGAREAREHREAGAQWVRRCGLDVGIERVLLTSGAQHALLAVLGTVTEPGDVVLANRYSNPGIAAAASFLRLRLRALPADEYGIVPDAFERAVGQERVRVLYCSPTVQNPTAVTMPLERRERIASIATAHGVAILEDDDYGPVIEDRPPPLAVLAPAVSYYVASLSKSLGFGLRVAYVVPPEPMVNRVLNSIRTSIWTVPPLIAEMATMWIADGTADRILDLRRREADVRLKLASGLLSGMDYTAYPGGYHLWLRLPPPWRSERLMLEAERAGVAVASAEEFRIGPDAEGQAVRVALGTPRSRALLRAGLKTLTDVIAQGPSLSVT